MIIPELSKILFIFDNESPKDTSTVGIENYVPHPKDPKKKVLKPILEIIPRRDADALGKQLEEFKKKHPEIVLGTQNE